MKVYLEDIEVEERDGTPTTVHWAGKELHVEAVVDRWIACTRWWQAHDKREYWVVRTNTVTIELYKRNTQWVLSRLFD